jgi:mandelamide amidase
MCGVVGYKPTPGRWPSNGVAPISHVLDAIGLLARKVEDCELVDAVLIGGPVSSSNQHGHLKGVRFAYAPRQHLVGVDEDVDRAFREVLCKVKDAGAELVEVDLGGDLVALANRITWPIFFHDTMSAIREFLAVNNIPVSLEEIVAGLGEHVHETWLRSVVPSGPGHVSDERHRVAVKSRCELQCRLVSIAFERADALLFPTTPCAAPRIADQWHFQVAGHDVTDTFLSRNTHPSNAAGVPGISLPMTLNAEGLPLGLEIDAAPGCDRDLLALARLVERIIGPVPGPDGGYPNDHTTHHNTDV